MPNPQSLVISKFEGLYKRRNSSSCPVGTLQTCTNMLTGDGSLRTRDGLKQGGSTIAGPFTAIGTVVNTDDGTIIGDNGSIVITGGVAQISGLAAGRTDFNFIKFFGNYFISLGVTPDFVRVFRYTVAPNGRSAAGPGATTAPTVAAGAAGTKNVPKGLHIWGVAFETDTGHVTVLPLTAFGTQFTHDGATKANLSNIPVGAAGTGTVKRHIVVSKVIPNFDGNTLNYEAFFLPGGIINDNTTTVLAGVEFYDSELVSSAEYLKDLSALIPYGLSFASYSGRMLTCASVNSITGIRSDVINVSNNGLPESFDTTSGFITVDPSVGGNGVRCCIEYKGNLIVFKDSSTYMTTDNGDLPNTWPVQNVSKHIGTTQFGICRVRGAIPGTIDDQLVILSLSGVYLFNGGIYNETALTRSIDAYYQDLVAGSITAGTFDNWRIVADQDNKLIYIAACSGSGDPDTLLVCDYIDGLFPMATAYNPYSVKWYVFNLYHDGSANSKIRSMTTVSNSVAEGGGVVIASATNVFALDTSTPGTDNGTAFAWAMETNELVMGDDLNTDQDTLLKFLLNRRTAAGNMKVTFGNSPAQTVAILNGANEQLQEMNINSNSVRPTLKIESPATSIGYLQYLKQAVILGVPREKRKPL